MKRATAGLFASLVFLGLYAEALQGAGPPGEPAAQGGGIEVLLKVDFSAGEHPFSQEGRGAIARSGSPDQAAGHRGLHVRRAAPEGYFGARTSQLAIRGSQDLRIAFCVRARGMHSVTVNLFDGLRRDNTTPASAARVQEDRWRTVVFAVEDFHYNSEPPHRKVRPETEFKGLLFHGRERRDTSGEFWIDKLVVYRGQDTQAPQAPGDLKAAAGAGGKVELDWKEPQDNAFPAVYSVFRKRQAGPWQKIGEAIPPHYTDAPPEAGRYTYRVAAADYDNNLSPPSGDAVVSVSSAAPAAAAAGPQIEDRLGYADHVRRIYAAGRGKVRHDVFLFAGDSITAADVYTYILGGWLGRGITVRQGVGQMRTDFGKNMIGKYLAEHRPEMAIVMYGTNDSKSPEAVQKAMQNLQAVVDACVQAGTIPILATIPPRGFDREKQQGETRFNEALVRLGRENKVPVSYCFEEMMGRDLRKMLSDGVHLVPESGNDAAGEALAKTIEQVYFSLRDSSADWKSAEDQ